MSKEAINGYSKTYVAIVEDNESLCRSLARLLRASGYHTVTYSSAESFLDDAKQPEFDCLIVDIQLDGMSGIKLIERLTESGSITPTIFLTARDDWRALKQTLHVPFEAFLRKRDPGEVLIAAIDKAIQSS